MYYCYILKNSVTVGTNVEPKKSTSQPKNIKTYNGFTTNPIRRLRQHNQEIKGGAKFTKKHGNKDWQMFVLIGGFPDSQNALQCEWRIKHPDCKRRISLKYMSPIGRINGLNEILKSEQWTSFTTIPSNTLILTIWITKEYSDKLDLVNIKPFVNLVIVDKLDLETLSIISIVDNDVKKICNNNDNLENDNNKDDSNNEDKPL